jgi:hypothetical protein
MKPNACALAILGSVFSAVTAGKGSRRGTKLVGLSHETRQGASCNAPTLIGTLRNMADTSRCVDPEGTAGELANVQTDLCDYKPDQIFKFCEDGTIRSSERGYCLDVRGYTGSDNVRIAPCEVYPTIQEDQQWERTNFEVAEINGIPQDVFRIVNVKSGLCLNIIGNNDGRGDIETYDCLDDQEDQKFFVIDRGAVIGEGKLVEKDSGKCLSPEGVDGTGNLEVADCVDEDHQAFTFYETGELVNDVSGHCIDINDLSGSGNIRMFACDNRDDQRWMKIFEGEDYFSLTSFATVSSDAYGETTHCMHVESSNVESHECNDVDYQKWTWVDKKWSTPMIWWGQVICNESGGISTSIYSSVEGTNTVTAEIAAEITQTILNSDTPKALSESFSSSVSESYTISASCDVYDDGQPFQSGCLWQWELETESLSLGTVKWQTTYFKCTKSNVAPECAPFEECADDDCTWCIADDEFSFI